MSTLWKSIWKKHDEVSVSSLESHSLEELVKELEITKEKKKKAVTYVIGMEEEEKFARQYSKLAKEDIMYLEKLSSRAKEIEEKKISLKGRLVKNNAALLRVSQHEDEIPDMIDEMRQIENRKKETESHIFYLKEEQSELHDERDTLLLGHKLLKGFTIFVIISIAITLFISFAFLQTLRENTVFVFTTIGFIVVLLVVGIIIFSEMIDKALIRNEKLQKKAVYYLNKSKLRLFNQAKYLEYAYNRLGVDSTAKLEMYYNRYLKNKNNEKIYLKMNDALNEIEEDMIAYLKQRNVDTDYIENFSEWLLTPKKLNQIKQISKNYEKAKEQLKGLEKYEEEILKEIGFIKGNNGMNDEIIQNLIASY